MTFPGLMTVPGSPTGAARERAPGHGPGLTSMLSAAPGRKGRPSPGHRSEHSASALLAQLLHHSRNCQPTCMRMHIPGFSKAIPHLLLSGERQELLILVMTLAGHQEGHALPVQISSLKPRAPKFSIILTTSRKGLTTAVHQVPRMLLPGMAASPSWTHLTEQGQNLPQWV